MPGESRILQARDSRAIRLILQQRPIDNVYIASRFQTAGVAAFGNPLIGWFERGRLASVLSAGLTLTPVNASPAALDAFAVYEADRRASSLVGARDEAMGLWERLCARNPARWANPREVRDHQRVMAIDHDADVRPDCRVGALGTRHLESYFAAARAMYGEELGTAPPDLSSYRNHVSALMMRGDAYGLVEAGQTVFKVDVAAVAHGVAQLGGVWLAPRLRGQGLSESLLAGVVNQLRRQWKTVSLYVNSYNEPAIRCYERVGFRTVSQCATILY